MSPSEGLECLEPTEAFNVIGLVSSRCQPGIGPEVRRKLGEAAVRAAKAVNYVGAGEQLLQMWPGAPGRCVPSRSCS